MMDRDCNKVTAFASAGRILSAQKYFANFALRVVFHAAIHKMMIAGFLHRDSISSFC
jgi:hypothetical protein